MTSKTVYLSNQKQKMMNEEDARQKKVKEDNKYNTNYDSPNEDTPDQ
jgi:hypothetical protein